MINRKPDSNDVEAALSEMLQNCADKYGVDRQRFIDAVRPLILNPRFVENQPSAKVKRRARARYEFLMDSPVVPFEEIFSLLPGDQAIKLLEQRPPDELAKRIAFAHGLADRHGCFYNLADWEEAISKFREHQALFAGPLLETGYPGKLFEISPWLDRFIGCVYPVKYRYDLGDSPWRTKTGFSRFGTGSACAYRDADYLEFLGAEVAARLDATQIRNEILTFRGEALDRLLLHLRQRQSGKMPLERALEIAADCLSRGQNYISRENMEFLRKQDELFDYAYKMLPIYDNAKLLHVKAGGLRDLARVIEQVTMELAIRPRSNIRARLSPFKAKAPRVGLALDLRDFYQDYALSGGHDFRPMYQAWEASKPEQKAYREQFWIEVDRVFNSYNKDVLSQSIAESISTTSHDMSLDRIIEHSGPEPGSTSRQSEALAKTEVEFVFRQSGPGIWTIAFKGRKFPIHDLIGLHYIAILLGSPGDRFHVNGLIALTKDRGSITISESHPQPSDEEIAQRGTIRTNIDEPVKFVDKKTFDEIQNTADELRAEIDDNSFSNPDKRMEAIDKLRRLEAYLTSARGLGGKARKFSDSETKARKSVSKDIAKAINEISKGDPACGDYLKKQIKKGIYCIYDPGNEKISWVL